LHIVKAFSVSRSTLQQVGCRWASCWEGTQLGQLTSVDQRDIPYNIIQCSAIKTCGGRASRSLSKLAFAQKPLSKLRRYGFGGLTCSVDKELVGRSQPEGSGQ